MVVALIVLANLVAAGVPDLVLWLRARKSTPAVSAEGTGRPEPAYWATVREIHQRTQDLIGRQRELEDIASFVSNVAGYLWLTGEAYAGKTSLLAEAVVVLQGKAEIVSYFLSRRKADADSSRFLATVVPELAYLLDVEPPDPNKDQFWALWRRVAERAGVGSRHLLLVVDGLDVDLRPPQLPSVAALLPTGAGGHAHVMVSSRPDFQFPADIPAGHPCTMYSRYR